MCDFIYLVLPDGADLEAAGAVMERHGRRLIEDTPRELRPGLAPGERAFRANDDQCECGTTLSARLDPGDREKERRELDEEAARLRSEGWAATKVRRWRAQREAAMRLAPGVQAPPGEPATETSEQAEWRAILQELLQEASPQAGLTVHWASDELRRGPVLPRAALTPGLWRLQESVLYTFTR